MQSFRGLSREQSNQAAPSLTCSRRNGRGRRVSPPVTGARTRQAPLDSLIRPPIESPMSGCTAPCAARQLVPDYIVRKILCSLSESLKQRRLGIALTLLLDQERWCCPAPSPVPMQFRMANGWITPLLPLKMKLARRSAVIKWGTMRLQRRNVLGEIVVWGRSVFSHIVRRVWRCWKMGAKRSPCSA
jgi:hypothetical protein